MDHRESAQSDVSDLPNVEPNPYEAPNAEASFAETYRGPLTRAFAFRLVFIPLIALLAMHLVIFFGLASWHRGEIFATLSDPATLSVYRGQVFVVLAFGIVGSVGLVVRTFQKHQRLLKKHHAEQIAQSLSHEAIDHRRRE